MYSSTLSAESEQQKHATKHVIDLRSDTVTKPTPAMRKAMFEAEVGDDVYGEDPTINTLEQRAAEIFGREAAIFVPTGTMGNQIAIRVHTQHGQEVVCEQRAHIFEWEMAMVSSYSGCMPRTVEAPDGVLTWKHIETQLSPKIYYRSQTGLISLENTHNMRGGAVTPKAILDEICDNAHERGLPVHLDGARVFNAAVALGIPVAELTAKLDSVMFCLSKGLGAPVGSLVVGSREFIDRARIHRKALGGGMRQAGILAAAGLVALEEGPKRLHEDQANAKFMAAELSRTPGIALDPASVQTNIVIFELTRTTTAELSQRLLDRNVRANGVGSKHMRLVTHLDVDRADCEAAVRAIQEIVSQS
ncbi:MAG TPA: low-specificity L-threonine aldolase [Terriglobales bacterium]|jgi:threonine aldolase